MFHVRGWPYHCQPSECASNRNEVFLDHWHPSFSSPCAQCQCRAMTNRRSVIRPVLFLSAWQSGQNLKSGPRLHIRRNDADAFVHRCTPSRHLNERKRVRLLMSCPSDHLVLPHPHSVCHIEDSVFRPLDASPRLLHGRRRDSRHGR